ncbi:MAG: hypothetical protein KJ905_00035 [Nanoarchaeota archaeon]|nr:hypothetical protein [Nanoarchaeota archaeon]MBU1501149.1 hypothetical protein [Nanoarchaeota archaeon]MBU2458829.1 hypothetical protein [Nanoarchaeota archaeon]
MNLSKKKALAKRTFEVGEERIVFIGSRLEDIKDAITKQDMRDLRADGAIIIKEVKGRKKVVRKRKRSQGNVKIRVNKRKRNYIILTRKFRKHVAGKVTNGLLSKDEAKDLRKKIRNKAFRSLVHLKEHLGDKK